MDFSKTHELPESQRICSGTKYEFDGIEYECLGSGLMAIMDKDSRPSKIVNCICTKYGKTLLESMQWWLRRILEIRSPKELITDDELDALNILTLKKSVWITNPHVVYAYISYRMINIECIPGNSIERYVNGFIWDPGTRIGFIYNAELLNKDVIRDIEKLSHVSQIILYSKMTLREYNEKNKITLNIKEI